MPNNERISPTMFDCVVIGVTLPGLFLGAMLVQAGKKVLLLERKPAAGGRISSWEREGFLSMQGIPRIRYGDKGPFSRICRQLGLDFHLEPLNQAWVLDTDEKLKRITMGKPGVLRAEFLSPLDRFTAWNLLRSFKKEKLEEMEEVSLEEWFVKNRIRASLQKYLQVLAYESTHCAEPDKISAGETLRCFQKSFEARAYLAYPRQGWEGILESLKQEISKNGEIRWQTKVDRIEIKDGKAVGVRVNTETVQSDCVVCAIPCQQLVSLLPEGATTSEYIQLCQKAEPSVALVVDIALKHRIFPRKGLWFFLDPPSYGTFLSNLSYLHAPAGKQLATFVCPCSQREARQPGFTETLEAKVEENIRKAIPSKEMAVEYIRSHMVRMLDSVAIRADQTRKDRPGYCVPNLMNCFLVGDSTCAPGACWEMEFESVLACYSRMTGGRD